MFRRNHDNASIESIKEEARAAAKKAANDIYNISNLHYRYNHDHQLELLQQRKHHIDQQNDDVNSHQSRSTISENHLSSSKSHQDAIHRGSTRAVNEKADNLVVVLSEKKSPNNENIIQNTNKDTKQQQPSQNHDVKIGLKWRRKKKYQGNDDHSSFYSDDSSIVLAKSKKVTKDASMCSFCGSVFSKESYATYHENLCIKRGVLDLKINKTADDTVSTTSTKVKLSVPMQGQILLSPQIRKYIVILDDTLINVVLRSKRLLLSREQLDSQRELALMARNRSFYDMRAIRSQELKVAKKKKMKRKRVGNNILRKIQNKLSDAYFIIKEGDDQNQLVDKYKWRKPDSEIKHDDDTTYINVIVKHSTKLLENYVDREAKLRWTKNNNKSIVQKNNFETIRDFTQNQAIRFAKFSLG